MKQLFHLYYKAVIDYGLERTAQFGACMRNFLLDVYRIIHEFLTHCPLKLNFGPKNIPPA